MTPVSRVSPTSVLGEAGEEVAAQKGGGAGPAQAPHERLYDWLGRVPNGTIRSLQGNFSLEDAQKVHAYVSGHLQEWGTLANQDGWVRLGEVEVKRISRKSVGAAMLPRTLTVVRGFDGRILHVFVHFNKSFGVDAEGKKVYEGALHSGMFNGLKVVFDSMGGGFYVVRQTKKLDSNAKVCGVTRVQSEVMTKYGYPVLLEGVHRKKDGDDRYFTIQPLYWGDAFDYFIVNAPALSEEQKLALASFLFSQLVEIQQNAIAHRDIKPDNFLVDHDSGRVVIADWDLAVGDIGFYHKDEELAGSPGFIPGFLYDQIVDPKLFEKFSKGAIDRYAMAVSLSEMFRFGYTRRGVEFHIKGAQLVKIGEEILLEGKVRYYKRVGSRLQEFGRYLMEIPVETALSTATDSDVESSLEIIREELKQIQQLVPIEIVDELSEIGRDLHLDHTPLRGIVLNMLRNPEAYTAEMACADIEKLHVQEEEDGGAGRA